MALLELNELRVEYRVRGAGRIAAVDGVTLCAERGQCVGLVGESGCGKSTLAQAIVGLTAPVSGEIALDGRRVWPRRHGQGSFARSVQMVFQDPYSSLNPRWTVGAALREVLRVHGLASRAGAAAEVMRLLECVEMDAGLAARFPHELSGGQRQRVAIARALAVNPALIVADEPVSALDVSVQVQVLNLLKRLQTSMGMAILFISHDLATVRYMCDHVSVMYRGRIVESSPTARLFARPAHPYTAALLSAAPDVEEGLRSRTEGSRRLVLVGEPPPATVQVDGCAFHPRCPWRADHCEEVDPVATDCGDGQRVCCHHPLS